MCQHCGGTCFLIFSAFGVFAARAALLIRDSIMRKAKNIRKPMIWIFIVFAGVVGFYPAQIQAEEKVKVIVTILPLVEFTEKVGGERVDVSVMVPAGADPHTYEPTPGQMKQLSDAELYVKVGSGVEFELAWMDKLKALNRKMAICNASKGIKLIGMDSSCGYGHKHAHGGKDPHTWLSPLNAIIMTANIRDALMDIDPAGAEFYARNAREYIIELNRLNSYARENLGKLKGTSFMVFHPAWGYYAADYGLVELAVQQRAKDPTPRQMAHLVREAREHGIKVIFASPQFGVRSARAIAREIDGRVEFIDPLAKDYVANLRKVTDILAETR